MGSGYRGNVQGPGKVVRGGRSAIDRRPFALPDTAFVPLASSANRRYADARDGAGTTAGP